MTEALVEEIKDISETIYSADRNGRTQLQVPIDETHATELANHFNALGFTTDISEKRHLKIRWQ
ncbi:hypothetical protein [Rothia sp. P5766]|uniref:hypothetical protein n=1 Tax=Rothia sp. P5766 TaxID=3402656 RepID=UPI003AEDFFFE